MRLQKKGIPYVVLPEHTPTCVQIYFCTHHTSGNLTENLCKFCKKKKLAGTFIRGRHFPTQSDKLWG